MKTLEVVWGIASYHVLQQSKFSENEILQFNALLNLGDISDLSSKEIKKIPEKLIFEKNNYNFENELNVILNALKENKKIRIWASRYNVNSYLTLLLICYITKNENPNIYVIFSDDYNEFCISTGMMKSNELEEIEKLEHKLEFNEIINYANNMEQLILENSEMRILNNKKIESVKLSYYNDLILDTLRKIGTTTICKLVTTLMAEKYLSEELYMYLIELLINDDKIKLVEISNERELKNIIEINYEIAK